MNLNEEQLREIENLAGLFFSVEDIAINLELDYDTTEALKDAVKFDFENVASKAYHKGRLTTEIELRTAIKQSSLNGSNPAQNTMLNFREQTQ